jgi:hypothetical protein
VVEQVSDFVNNLVLVISNKSHEKNCLLLRWNGPWYNLLLPTWPSNVGIGKEASLDFLSRKNGPRSIGTFITRGVTLGNCVIIPNVKVHTFVVFLSWGHGLLLFTHYFSKAK